MAFDVDLSWAKLIAGVAGSLVSLRFVPGTALERAMMAVGGSALSYYATEPMAQWAGMTNAEGLVGFLIGLFGMSVMAKAYEVIMLTSAADVLETIKRKWSA